MTLDVYRGRKTTMQQQQHNTSKSDVNVIGEIKIVLTFINFTDFKVKFVHFLPIQNLLLFSIFPFSVNGPLSF